MRVCFCCFRFSFSVLSQEIGWEDRLRNDLFCVGGGGKDVNPQLSQSVSLINFLDPYPITPTLFSCRVQQSFSQKL